MDASGAPTETVLTSAVVPGSDVPPVPSESFVAVAFSPGAQVQAGTQYALVAHVTGGNALYTWDKAASGAYPGGSLWRIETGDLVWFPREEIDLAFKTYVAAADTTAPTSTATFKTTAGATVGTIGPVRCWNGRGVRVTLNATDTGSGVNTLTYAAADTAGNAEQPAHSQTVLVGPTNRQPFGCALATPSRFPIPAHGSATVTGTAVIGPRAYPFTTTIKY